MKHKKGFMGDALFNIVYLFFIGIFIISFYMIISNIDTIWSSNPDIPEQSKNIFGRYADRFAATNDSMFLLITIGFMIAIVVSAILIRSHPVFGVIAIIIMIVFVAASIYITNSFREFTSNSEIGSYALDFPMMTTIINNLPKFALFMMVVFIIVLFAKGKQGSGTI